MVLQALQRAAKHRGIGIQLLGERLIFRFHIVDHCPVRQHLFDYYGDQIVTAYFSFARIIDATVDAIFEDHIFFARKRLLIFLTGTDVFLLDFIQVLENLLRDVKQRLVTLLFSETKLAAKSIFDTPQHQPGVDGNSLSATGGENVKGFCSHRGADRISLLFSGCAEFDVGALAAARFRLYRKLCSQQLDFIFFHP